MRTSSGRKADYRFMAILALIVGLVGIALQFTSGWEIMSFMLTVAALGGLIASENGYEQSTRQQFSRSYKVTFERLLLIMMAAYAFIELSKWLPIPEEPIRMLNSHWPGLIIAAMCALMGIAGLQTGTHGDTSA